MVLWPNCSLCYRERFITRVYWSIQCHPLLVLYQQLGGRPSHMHTRSCWAAEHCDRRLSGIPRARLCKGLLWTVHITPHQRRSFRLVSGHLPTILTQRDAACRQCCLSFVQTSRTLFYTYSLLISNSVHPVSGHYQYTVHYPA